MPELPMHILTDAGFTTEQANSVVEALINGTNLHGNEGNPYPVDIDELPPDQKDALERFNLAVAGDA